LTIGPLTLPSPRWGEGRVRGDTNDAMRFIAFVLVQGIRITT